MIYTLYSTIGMILDLLVISFPILVKTDFDTKTKIKFTIMLFLCVKLVLNVLYYKCIFKYMFVIFIISYLLYLFKFIKDFHRVYIYVLYFSILFTCDYIGFNLLNEFNFFVYTILYKMILIAFLYKINLELDKELKMKMMSGSSMLLIILISIIIGGL